MVKRPEMLNQTKSSVWNSLLVVVCGLLVGIFFFNIWFVAKFFVVQVSGGSMNDTLYGGYWLRGAYTGGDILYADRNATARRGDIVIVNVENNYVFADNVIIKRLVAVEGDTIKCENYVVYIQYSGTDEFVELKEDYVSPRYWTYDFAPVTVPEGKIFVLGDHRTNSFDSRDAGCLNYADIMGVVPEWAVEHRGLIRFLESLRSPFSNL